jgi:hypothetical protein
MADEGVDLAQAALATGKPNAAIPLDNVRAMYAIALFYEYGYVVSENKENALEWRTKAIFAGTLKINGGKRDEYSKISEQEFIEAGRILKAAIAEKQRNKLFSRNDFKTVNPYSSVNPAALADGDTNGRGTGGFLDVNNQNKTNETIFTKFNPHSMYDNNLKLTRPENAFAAGKKNRKTKKNNRNTKKLTKKTNVHKKQNKHRNKTHKKLSKTLSTKKK